MLVMKFGGSSLANGERIREVAEIIKKYLDKKPIVVLSAMGKTTDNLLEAGQLALKGSASVSKVAELHYDTIKELGLNPVPEVNGLLTELEELLTSITLIKELVPRTNDYLVSFGERLSVRIMEAYLKSQGIDSKHHDAFDIGFVSDSNFMNAELLEETPKKIRKSLQDVRYLPIVTGFLAKDKEGNITTLGRGGSDLTASVLAASLNAEEVIYWKDVDGILTTDPRIVKNAQPVSQVSFPEAAELAYFGAKVLHPRSIKPACDAGIPVRLKNSYNIDHPGTMVVNNLDEDRHIVRAITCKRNVTMIDICSTRMLGAFGFLERVFQIFSQYKISVDLIATSEVSITLTLDSAHDYDAIKEILGEIATIRITEGKASVSLVGDVHRSSEMMEKVFTTLKSADVNVLMLSQGASRRNISFVVEDDQAEECVKLLHKAFFEE